MWGAVNHGVSGLDLTRSEVIIHRAETLAQCVAEELCLMAYCLHTDLHRVAALHSGNLREVLYSGEHAEVSTALQNHPECRRLQH